MSKHTLFSFPSPACVPRWLPCSGQGSPFVSEDLVRAGVRHAASALVFKQSLCSVDNAALLDADMVCIYRWAGWGGRCVCVWGGGGGG